MALAGWYRDPMAQADGRYWDGQRWTDSVTRGGYTLNEPIDPARVEIPPPPGTELTSAPPPAPQTPNITVSTAGSGQSRTPVAAILGGLAIAIAVIAIIIALANSGDSDDNPPATTQAPATTAAPAEDGG